MLRSLSTEIVMMLGWLNAHTGTVGGISSVHSSLILGRLYRLFLHYKGDGSLLEKPKGGYLWEVPEDGNASIENADVRMLVCSGRVSCALIGCSLGNAKNPHPVLAYGHEFFWNTNASKQ